ncbi:MAG: PAS domain-containing protein [Prevotella sp.]|nr:PAS domain-containing protein [Prevotella sp.]
MNITLIALPLIMVHLLPVVLLVLGGLALAGMLVATRVVSERLQLISQRARSVNTIMQQALTISANNVVRYDLHDQYIYQLFGHLFPEGGVTLDEWKRHLHPDDYDATLEHFHRIIRGEAQREEFDYRWNLDYSGGTPRWAHMHNVSMAEYDHDTSQLRSIISTLKDETELRQQEQEEQRLGEQYKMIFEHSVMALSFYSPDGRLLDANDNMRRLCHFDTEEGDAFFSNANLFDVPPFSEVLDRNNVEEFWACSQSIIPERNLHDYLEIRVHPIRDDNGQLVYIAISARNITEERDLYLQARLNDEQIRQANAEIQGYENELRYLMEGCDMQAWRISLDRNCIEFYRSLDKIDRTFPLQQLPKIFVHQDDEFVRALANPAQAISKPLSYMGQMHPVVTQRSNEPQWVQVNCIPEHDKHGRLKGAFGVWRNITSLMKKQELLRRETERANDSGRLKSVFLANMTHEIRTPLNAIVGFSDLLQAIEQPEEKREMIRIIHNNCDMLLRLIDDIFLLSNVDANAMQIMATEIDFSPMFDDVCQSLAQRVQEPGVEFQKDNPMPSLKVCIDMGRIQQVITNFVTNAVKYTHQGHIRVGYRLMRSDELPAAAASVAPLPSAASVAAPSPSAAAASPSVAVASPSAAVPSSSLDGLYVYCEDTGSGIPADQRERVFERFVKLNDFIQGTGLGLSICKAIIEKCNGRIGVDSEEGRGSTFWFWIPV